MVRRPGGEMVDTGALKAPSLRGVPVRLRPRARYAGLPKIDTGGAGKLTFSGTTLPATLLPLPFESDLNLDGNHHRN